jgi:hypothetical protein
MNLDREALDAIDRMMFVDFGHDERYRMVRVPVSEAMWSMWRRYCQALGVSMGRGIAGLVAHELGAVADPDADGVTVYAAEMQRRFATRSGGPRCSRTPPRRTGAVAAGIQTAAPSTDHPARIAGPGEGRSQRAVPVWFRIQVQTMSRALCRRIEAEGGGVILPADSWLPDRVVVFSERRRSQ